MDGGRGRERIRLLLSDVMKKKCMSMCEVSLRIMWVKVQLGVEKWVFVSMYGSRSEKREEKDLFWDRLNECLGSFRENVKVVVLGDLNAKVRNELAMDEIGKY